MATETPVPALVRARSGQSRLAAEWRKLTRIATIAAVITAPAVLEYLHAVRGWSWTWSVVGTFLEVIAFRGLMDVALRRFIPWPSLFGVEADLQQEDVVARRRVWFWRFWLRAAVWLVAFGIVVEAFNLLLGYLIGADWISRSFGPNPAAVLIQLLIQMPLFFLVNFLIFFGPFLLMAASQIRSYEPGDADWGVKLEDVRGQAEAKEEVRRVVTLWQSGEAFERAGGKRERGLLFLGAPGTGKTMLAKAIATWFTSPFVSIPASGFAQSFMGMDAVIVRYLARKAKKQARKWGGQCIVFIDEIDAVGSRRSQPAGGGSFVAPAQSFHDHCFYGPNGALTPTGDLILETRAWREKVFARRAERPAPTVFQRIGGTLNQAFPGMMGGMGGGQLALNQLLVVMEAIDNPPFSKRTGIRLVNTFLDASWIVPERIGSVRLRLPAPRPRNEQIYFIGATNVPLDALDPAL